MCATTQMNLKYITPIERSQNTKGHILYDSIYIKCSEQIQRDREIRVCQGMGVGERE